jgi:DNA-binding PadR family transcriptional regulator
MIQDLQDLNSFLPLSPVVLQILLSLAVEERHGYGIMQEVARQSDGRYKISPGTLYDNLQKLMEQGLIEEVVCPRSNDDPRRRYYEITTFGRRILSAEVTRLEVLVRKARSHLRTSNTRGTP